ncbi:MAG TPA: hypothetical protein VFR67_10570 [Pilimelia sp.]|nr:hypothetical protein [Pilimelia sp.]
MASGKIRRIVTAAALTTAPVLFFATPAAAQGSVPWHQSGAGGSLHQIGAPWHQDGSGSATTDVTDAAVFDARF